MAKADESVWFEFVESKIFTKQVSQLPPEILTSIHSDLVQNPERGDIVKGTHGVRKARVADPGSSRGKSGSYRYFISTLSMLAGFTCSTYSAKVSKRTYRRIKRASSVP